MGNVEHAIEDGVGEGGVAEIGVPAGGGDLAAEDGGAEWVARSSQISRKSRRSDSDMDCMAKSSSTT